MNRTWRLLRCSIRLITTAVAGNWPEYDQVCAEIDAIHAEVKEENERLRAGRETAR